MINNLERRTDWLTDWGASRFCLQLCRRESKIMNVHLFDWRFEPKKNLSTVNYLHKLSQSMKAAEKTPLFCFVLLCCWRRMVERLKQKSNQIKSNYYYQLIITVKCFHICSATTTLYCRDLQWKFCCCLSWPVTKRAHTHIHIDIYIYNPTPFLGSHLCKRYMYSFGKVMPSWVWVASLIWCFIPSSGCYPQSNEILLNTQH